MNKLVIMLVTQDGYGISVDISEKELEHLKNRIEKGDLIEGIEER